MANPKFNDDPAGYGGHFTTQSAALAAVLASLGFAYRGTAPIQLIIDSRRVANFVDRGKGEISDCVRTAFHFDYLCEPHPILGQVSASQIEAAYELRELNRKKDAGEFIAPSRLKPYETRLRAHARRKEILQAVHDCADAMENLCLLSAGVEELADDPLLRTTRALRRGKLDFVRPIETEPVAQRIMERFNARDGDPLKQPLRHG